jgi:hypothetical protein
MHCSRILIYIFLIVNKYRQAMVTDVQLGVFSNVMGVLIFLLIVLYHYVTASRDVRTEL